MGDLINRKTLMEEIESLRVTIEGKDVFPSEVKKSVLKTIDAQPTAYNVDAVVNEIIDIIDNDLQIKYVGQAVQKAVKIVKAGGKNE